MMETDRVQAGFIRFEERIQTLCVAVSKSSARGEGAGRSGCDYRIERGHLGDRLGEARLLRTAPLLFNLGVDMLDRFNQVAKDVDGESF